MTNPVAQSPPAASQVRAEGVLVVVAGVVVAGVVVAVVLLLVVVVLGAVVCVVGGGMAGWFRWCSGIGGSSVGKRYGRSRGRHARSIAAPAEGQPTR